jgi:hypothetical protein
MARKAQAAFHLSAEEVEFSLSLLLCYRTLDQIHRIFIGKAGYVKALLF